MAKMTYSFSRLSLYKECPYRFYLRYVEKREEPITEPLALGKAAHKAIELIIQGYDLEEALFIANMESELILNTEELRKLVIKVPIRKGEGLKKGVEVEKYFNLPLSDSPDGPYIQGYIDLVQNVFGTYSFFDWKTNRVSYNPSDTMQLPLYAWALSQLYKVAEVTGTLFFLRYFKNALKRMTFTSSDMENARAWAEKTAIEIENKLFLMECGVSSDELFPGTPNPHCKHCSFAAECLLKNEKELFGGILYDCC